MTGPTISSEEKNVKTLTTAWRRFDADPPLELLTLIADRFDVSLAEGVIDELGAAGRIPGYAPHFQRLLALRTQGRQLREGRA